MRWSDIPWTPAPRTLRQFAGLWLVFFGVIACRHAWDGHAGLAWTFGIVAGVVGVLGLVQSHLVRPIFVGWMVAAYPIGWIVSLVVLAVMWYGLFTPLGMIFRLMGRDALRLRPQADEATYWAPKPSAPDVRGYFRQF